MAENEGIRLGEGEGEEGGGGEDQSAALQAEIDELKSRMDSVESTLEAVERMLRVHDLSILECQQRISYD